MSDEEDSAESIRADDHGDVVATQFDEVVLGPAVIAVVWS